MVREGYVIFKGLGRNKEDVGMDLVYMTKKTGVESVGDGGSPSEETGGTERKGTGRVWDQS